MVIIDNRKIAEMQRVLVEGDDLGNARRVLRDICSIPHEPTRIGMLDYAATHCGLDEIALDAFDRLIEALKEYPPDVKAGQVEDMYFRGTRTPEIADRAIRYTLSLVESGELGRDLAPTRNFLEFVAQKKEGRMRDRAREQLGL